MGEVILRPYQEEAIEAVMSAMQEERYILLQAATGAGKTILFSELIKRILRDYSGMRIAVLAHRKELITQAADKLRKVWPGAPIGLACAGVSNNVNLDAPVVIGSIQTLANRLNTTAPFHMVIIDEAHRIPPIKKKEQNQYLSFLTRMESYFPELRVLGVTATPYRLGHGYIYGDRCKSDQRNLFGRLHFSIGIQDLQDQGYLCGIRAKEAEDIEMELAGIRTSGGDYNLGDLSKLMSKSVHVGSAVNAYEKYGEGRRHVVVFCCTIEHAETVMEAFKEAGYSTGCVHSQMPGASRDGTLEQFNSGEIRILTNVGVLTEGWDSPAVDCILMCRPTKSPALYVQMLGRGTRIHPGKTDLLVLDLSGNIHQHGNPDRPVIKIPNETNKEVPKSTKTCPNCQSIVAAQTIECPECGHVWDRTEVEQRNESVDMRDVSIMGKQQPIQSFVLEDYAFRDFTSRKGNRMLEILLEIKEGTIPTVIHDFWDLEGNGSAYGKGKARTKWRQLSGGLDPPETVDEGMRRFLELQFPEVIKVQEDGKYLRWVL